jgi:hypothetical protein
MRAENGFYWLTDYNPGSSASRIRKSRPGIPQRTETSSPACPNGRHRNPPGVSRRRAKTSARTAPQPQQSVLRVRSVLCVSNRPFKRRARDACRERLLLVNGLQPRIVSVAEPEGPPGIPQRTETSSSACANRRHRNPRGRQDLLSRLARGEIESQTAGPRLPRVRQPSDFSSPSKLEAGERPLLTPQQETRP